MVTVRETLRGPTTSRVAEAAGGPFRVRPAAGSEVEAIAALWESGWHDGHASISPPALIAQRTAESFRVRTRHALADTRVLVGPDERLAGFWMRRPAEVYQFYVAAPARGTAAGRVLMDDALAVLGAEGPRAWLYCGIGNDRARAFYEKTGWHLARTEEAEVDTLDGPFAVRLWRFEIALPRP